jgi:septal ring factor EnvC (AmiA/AmiB activator)
LIYKNNLEIMEKLFQGLRELRAHREQVQKQANEVEKTIAEDNTQIKEMLEVIADVDQRHSELDKRLAESQKVLDALMERANKRLARRGRLE